MFCYCGRECNFTSNPLASYRCDEKGNIVEWLCIHGEGWRKQLPRVLQRYEINEFNNEFNNK